MKNLMMVMFMVAVMFTGTSVFADDNANRGVTSTNANHSHSMVKDNDDDGDAGLWGLLGLAGLAGLYPLLRRRTNVVTDNTSTNRTF